MDPVSAAFFAVVVASWWVSKRGGEFRDRAFAAAGSDRHALRMQERQHEHERRMTAQKQRHELRLAGKPVAPIQEAVAHRIRQPKARADMHGARAWWFDLCADRAEELTRQRREREQRTAAGQQEWQKFGRAFRAWYRRAGERAGQRWQERNAPRDPHRRWVDSERADDPASTNWPDPNAHNPGTEDAQVVDDPQPQPRERPTPGRPELEPGWPEPESMPCPSCRGSGCETCGGDGRVPSWLADPAINTAAGEWAASPATENPPGTVRAVAERIPELPDGNPAGTAINQGASMPEIVSPETARADAEFISTEIAALLVHVDARLGEMTRKEIQGADEYAAMREQLAVVVTKADDAVQTFAGHIAKRDALHAGGAPGDGDYMGLDVGTGIYSMHHGIPGGGGN